MQSAILVNWDFQSESFFALKISSCIQFRDFLFEEL